MFTGLIEGQATVVSVTPEGAAVRLSLEMPAEYRGEVRLGDSVAINGCCLTVVDIAGSTCAFQAGTETLSKTNLGELRPGSRANVERALSVGARLGGHFVQGHVDGTGRVAKIEQDGEWTTMWFQVPAPLTRQMVRKGSITVDGISLTVARLSGLIVEFAVIPFTYEHTNICDRRPGDALNLEGDILGKYVESYLEARKAGANAATSALTIDVLKNQGF